MAFITNYQIASILYIMNLFAYIPDDNGKETLGTENKMFIRDLKTINGAIRRLKTFPKWNSKPFVLQTYTSATNAETYKTIYTHKP